jgi:hypothetical protein
MEGAILSTGEEEDMARFTYHIARRPERWRRGSRWHAEGGVTGRPRTSDRTRDRCSRAGQAAILGQRRQPLTGA